MPSVHLQRAIMFAALALVCAVLREPFGCCVFAFFAFVGVAADALAKKQLKKEK